MNIAVLILRIKKAEVSNGSNVREGGSTVRPAGARRARTARMPYNDFAAAKNTVLNLVLNLVCIRPYQRYPGTAVLPG